MARFLCWLAITLLPAGAMLATQVTTKPAGDDIYELPPFVTHGFTMGTNWRHVEIPGYEILSQCSDRETREIVAALWRGRQLVLPEAMRPRFSLPMTVVLYNQPGSAGGGLASFGSRQAPREIQPHWINLIKRTLEDRESFALNLWPGSFNYSAAFRFDLFTLFRRRTPAVPTWLEEGMFGGYGVYREGVYWYESSGTKGVHVAIWCSAEEAKGAVGFYQEDISKGKASVYKTGIWPKSGSRLQTYLVELPALFEQPPPAEDTPEWHRWAATLALFVRWGTYDCPEAQVAQFWRFAERACSEVVSETLFKECFGGRSYAEIRAELSWYLPLALTRQGEATAYDVKPVPKLPLKDATGVQIARVRGEWERMEAAALAARFPEVAAKYREQAARTLVISPKDSSLDPRVQASLGLLALGNGDFAAARAHLELAVAGKVPGPRPYGELARLRWMEGRLDDTGRLPPEKLAGVVALIMAAEQQQPPLASIYLLLVEALKQGPAPDAEQRAALERGRKYFPRNAEVQAAIVRLLGATKGAPAAK
jgi:hypothetical protein